MPDFTARITAGAAVDSWLDPARPALTQGPNDPGAPSRLNPRPGYPHKRWVAQPSVAVTFKATVAGVEGPLDTALGGRLFYCWPIEQPTGSTLPVFTHPAGQTSVRTVLLVAPGHYLFGFGRHGGGGAVLMHVDVD